MLCKIRWVHRPAITRLNICCPKGHAGSTPALSTKEVSMKELSGNKSIRRWRIHYRDEREGQRSVSQCNQTLPDLSRSKRKCFSAATDHSWKLLDYFQLPRDDNSQLPDQFPHASRNSFIPSDHFQPERDHFSNPLDQFHDIPDLNSHLRHHF